MSDHKQEDDLPCPEHDLFTSGQVQYTMNNIWSKNMKAKKKSIYREKIHGVEVRDLGDEHFLGGLNQQGLFATKTFYEYDIIGEYAGRVVPSLVKGQYVACLESKHFEDSLGVEALETGNEMRFINSYQNIDFFPNVSPFFFNI